MAVPKKKTSKSRKNMRRAHDFLTPTVRPCPQCKAPKLPHCACPSCGTYKGRQVMKPKSCKPRFDALSESAPRGYMRVAVDVMGGDNAPIVEVEGAVAAAREFGVPVTLVGDTERVQAGLARHDCNGLDIGRAMPAKWSACTTPPRMRCERRRIPPFASPSNWSRQGEAAAVVSAGNSGATMAAGMFVLKRMQGIDRRQSPRFSRRCRGKPWCSTSAATSTASRSTWCSSPSWARSMPAMSSEWIRPRVGLFQTARRRARETNLPAKPARSCATNPSITWATLRGGISSTARRRRGLRRFRRQRGAETLRRAGRGRRQNAQGRDQKAASCPRSVTSSAARLSIISKKRRLCRVWRGAAAWDQRRRHDLPRRIQSQGDQERHPLCP